MLAQNRLQKEVLLNASWIFKLVNLNDKYDYSEDDQRIRFESIYWRSHIRCVRFVISLCSPRAPQLKVSDSELRPMTSIDGSFERIRRLRPFAGETPQNDEDRKICAARIEPAGGRVRMIAENGRNERRKLINFNGSIMAKLIINFRANRKAP